MTRKGLSENSSLKLAVLFPNMITMAAILFGISAFRHALSDKFELAVMFIIAAMVMDGLYGKLARSLGAETQIGRELDSLADFFNFGVVPAFVCHLCIFQGEADTRFSWIAVMSVVGCCAFRLARFNAEDKENKTTTLAFRGVPAPMLGLLILMPVLAVIIGLPFVQDYTFLVSIYLIFCAFLAASSIPTISLKSIALTKTKVYLALLSCVLGFATFVTFPWASLMAIGLAYLAYMPIFAKRFRAKDVAAD